MIINDHVLVHAEDAGNGYHGRCKYCNMALVTDLGYCSWTDTKCIDREITNYSDIPKNIREYASFRGLRYDPKLCLFIKPYSDETYTIDQLNDKLGELVKTQ